MGTGLAVNASESRAEGPGLKSTPGYCVMSFGKTFTTILRLVGLVSDTVTKCGLRKGTTRNICCQEESQVKITNTM